MSNCQRRFRLPCSALPGTKTKGNLYKNGLPQLMGGDCECITYLCFANGWGTKKDATPNSEATQVREQEAHASTEIVKLRQSETLPPPLLQQTSAYSADIQWPRWPLTSYMRVRTSVDNGTDLVRNQTSLALPLRQTIEKSWRVGGFLLRKVFDIRLCMFPSCSHCFTGLRTHFVFSLAQLLPMVIVFVGFNGNFNGKMTKINKMAKNHFSGV